MDNMRPLKNAPFGLMAVLACMGLFANRADSNLIPKNV
jgi:hypothetical protein